MNIIELVENMSEDMYLKLKCAAETGKWPDGNEVDEATRNSSLQITMAYQAKRQSNDEIMTVGQDGEIVNKSKSELRNQFSSQDTIAKFTKL